LELEMEKKKKRKMELQMKQEMDRAVFALHARMERMLRQNCLEALAVFRRERAHRLAEFLGT